MDYVVTQGELRGVLLVVGFDDRVAQQRRRLVGELSPAGRAAHGHGDQLLVQLRGGNGAVVQGQRNADQAIGMLSLVGVYAVSNARGGGGGFCQGRAAHNRKGQGQQQANKLLCHDDCLLNVLVHMYYTGL